MYIKNFDVVLHQAKLNENQASYMFVVGLQDVIMVQSPCFT
jgi:hypothetical protein